ncbi:hypothetical protein [Blastococcus brunescens]|uniref:LPXTG-motif cell wall anchor domain-containing protein n=1 Tax=Blastococcus brunescens TaxID=1564165 RepID=A0ABZ1B516_9ACTN|nr:hypothetical protein [Blastococcus sp. BMG 8361]WRL65900.1 hypothetical protein U6N30_10305 [Blastococcus sp. BMG 8361]
MSRNTQKRRPQRQRFTVVGLGAAALLAGTASGASAAPGVVIPLAPGEVALEAFPVENFGAMDPMADPNTAPVLTSVGVQYGGTITVNLPAELDDSAVVAELDFDDDGDGTADVTYSSALAPADPLYLAIAGAGTGSIEVTLPADDGSGTDLAALYLEPLTTPTLGPAFTYYDPVVYALDLAAAGAAAAVTVEPALLAASQVPCDISSATRCAFPSPVTVGSTVTLDLTAGSVLRELGITDLTGVQVGLQQLDANGDPVGAPVALTVQVTGATASFVVPAGAAAGSYGLVIAQQAPSGSLSIVLVEVSIVAEAAPVAVTPAVNAGLSSNTGVEIVGAGSGTLPVAAGAGLLLLSAAGGLALVRTRRRPAAEGGTCEF